MVLAVTAFPDAQKKAQEELDRVVGSDRAPEWEDLQDLPYIRALVKEVHRFRPVAPLIPRAATADLSVSPESAVNANALLIRNCSTEDTRSLRVQLSLQIFVRIFTLRTTQVLNTHDPVLC